MNIKGSVMSRDALPLTPIPSQMIPIYMHLNL